MKNHPYKSQLSWIRLIKVDNLYVLENKIVITNVHFVLLLSPCPFHYFSQSRDKNEIVFLNQNQMLLLLL